MKKNPTAPGLPLVGNIISSYEGQPPDNACNFIEWIEKVKETPLSGAFYAVFGCGNRRLTPQTNGLL